MTLLIVLLALILLILLITIGKVNPFLAFLIVCIITGLLLGIPISQLTRSIEKGLGDTLGSIVSLIVLGAMLGKLIADSGAAQRIASTMMRQVGMRNIQWAMMITGFIIGLPLFYGTGFVLMIPLIFSVVYQYKLPAVYIGLPMLASLSVAHGFLPPHPSPSALVIMFHATIGTTLMYGILIAIPTIIIAGPLFSKTLKNIQAMPLETFRPASLPKDKLPPTFNSFLAALLPVVLFMVTSLLPFIAPPEFKDAIGFLGSPAIVMLIALLVATFTLGVGRGRTMKEVMNIYSESVKDVAMILLIIGGAGALTQILKDSGVSTEIANHLNTINLHPLILGWLIAAIIRVAVGSATVAGFTAAGIIQPLIIPSHTNPNLMVLAIGAGSLMFSHVNDSGFWLFKEYFNISIRETLRSWSLMETIVSIVGLLGVLLLNLIV